MIRREDSDIEPTLIVELIFWGSRPGPIPADWVWREGDLKAPPAILRFKADGWLIKVQSRGDGRA